MPSKSIFVSKTFWLAIMQAIAGSATSLLSHDPMIRTAALGLVAKSVVDIALRAVTTGEVHVVAPIGQ